MLRLRQIEIAGFKSFCNRERLRFAGQGIAAVVGPNGCGKSNICDAINWALGEQSAKSLRGGRMRDVIFSGTSRRAPADLATVTLTLRDPEGLLAGNGDRRSATPSVTLPVAKRADEIVVTRKLFRNGQSKYLINGKVVRLMDIRDIFLGTGLGMNDYAIIGQGRIGRLLNARSVERREFLEEAAGITRFKSRRRAAELKLANASLNLERVYDILLEVRRQAASLERQAKRAERYQCLRTELRAAQEVVVTGRLRQIEAERRRLSAQLEMAKSALRKETAKRDRLSTEFAGVREREQAWELILRSLGTERTDLHGNVERTREQVKQQAAQAEGNEQECRRARSEIAAVEGRIGNLVEALSAMRIDVAKLAEEFRRSGESLDAAQRRCNEKVDSLKERESELDACRRRKIEAINAVSKKGNNLARLDATLKGLGASIEEVTARRSESQEDLAKAIERRAALGPRVVELQTRVNELTAVRDALVDASEKEKAQLRVLRRTVEEARGKASELRARRDSIQKLLADREHSTDTVKEVFAAVEKKPREGFAPRGILADFLEVDDGFETAVEHLLGRDLECLVVGDWSEADRGVQIVRDEHRGRAAFLVRSSLNGSSHPGPAVIMGATSLAEHVRLVNDLAALGGGCIPKLRDGYVVPKGEVAQSLAEGHPDLYFVTTEGVLYHGSTVQAGRRDSYGPLVQKHQLRELAPDLKAADAALSEVEAQTEDIEASLGRNESDLAKAQVDLRKAESNALESELELQTLNGRVTGLEASGQALNAEIGKLEATRVETRAQRTRTAKDLEGLRREFEDEKNREATLAAVAAEERAALATIQEVRSQLRTDAARLEERHRSVKAELARMETDLDTHRSGVAKGNRHVLQLQVDRGHLLADNKRLSRLIADRKRRMGAIDLEVERTNVQLRASKDGTAGLFKSLNDQTGVVETRQRELSAIEVGLAGLASDRNHLAVECEDELGSALEKVSEGIPEDLSEDDLKKATEALRDLKRKLQNLGPVNILAQDEYREVAQRQEFLETQQNDLVDAITNTRSAIREIDIASQEKFDKGFREINDHFRSVFAILFGGGTGEMRLTDPHNRDESGIDIVAQPPGKRLQSVALLSGGEKSLTVMALLLATFRFKPSPFCVLDEVDAQLDETNTVRLRRLLQEMASETQFIVITHSKTTMEVAESLYGVTMGEAGVSKVVSVRMVEAEASVSRPVPTPNRKHGEFAAVGA